MLRHHKTIVLPANGWTVNVNCSPEEMLGFCRSPFIDDVLDMLGDALAERWDAEMREGTGASS